MYVYIIWFWIGHEIGIHGGCFRKLIFLMIHETLIWNGTVSGLVAVVICNVQVQLYGKTHETVKIILKKILTFTSFVALNDVKSGNLRRWWL